MALAFLWPSWWLPLDCLRKQPGMHAGHICGRSCTLPAAMGHRLRVRASQRPGACASAARGTGAGEVLAKTARRCRQGSGVLERPGVSRRIEWRELPCWSWATEGIVGDKKNGREEMGSDLWYTKGGSRGPSRALSVASLGLISWTLFWCVIITCCETPLEVKCHWHFCLLVMKWGEQPSSAQC